MAKSSKKTGVKTTAESNKNFEDRLERLEKLGEQIRKTDIPLDEALKAFEEGIKLARTLEKDLEKIESRIEMLMNSHDADVEEEPVLELFRDFE
jgi:exodeoxyribonuclease VII small subunit